MLRDFTLSKYSLVFCIPAKMNL